MASPGDPLECANSYSLNSPPKRRALQQEKSQYLEGEKAKTDCNVEYERLESDPLRTLALSCATVDEVQKPVAV